MVLAHYHPRQKPHTRRPQLCPARHREQPFDWFFRRL